MPVDLTALSTALANLASTPGAVQLLGAHLTSSQEMQAVAILDQMAANPTGAAAAGVQRDPEYAGRSDQRRRHRDQQPGHVRQPNRGCAFGPDLVGHVDDHARQPARSLSLSGGPMG